MPFGFESVGGLQGRPYGEAVQSTTAATITAERQISQNPLRMWLLIQNKLSSPDAIRVSFGIDNANSPYVYPGGHIIIDKNMPWTDRLSIVPVGASADISIVEVSVSENK